MLRVTFKSIFYLHCHTQHNLYLGSHALLHYALTIGSTTKSHILTMVKTRWMPNDCAISVTTQPHRGQGKSNTPLTDAKGEVTIATPPMVKTRRMTNDGAISATTQPRRGQGKSNTPSTDAKGEVTIATPPPLLRQGQQSTASTDAAKQKANKCHEKSRHIASNILCICLRCHIAKIKQMCTDVVEGYGKFYEQLYGKPLPQDVINQIQLLYRHRIKHRCAKSQLTVEAEEEWNPDNASIDELGLLDSGEESKEHDSYDITFYDDSIDDVNKEEGVTKH
jgi:hypothetical protein